MEFVVIASFLVIVSIIIGRISNKEKEKSSIEESCLYDKQTINIMKNYKLINDDEYRLMVANLKKKE